MAFADEAEEKKRQDLRAQAKKELDEWYTQRDAQLKIAKEANRSDSASWRVSLWLSKIISSNLRFSLDQQCLSFRKTEAEHLAAFAKAQGDGAQWDEVAKLCGDQKNVKVSPIS